MELSQALAAEVSIPHPLASDWNKIKLLIKFLVDGKDINQYIISTKD